MTKRSRLDELVKSNAPYFTISLVWSVISLLVSFDQICFADESQQRLANARLEVITDQHSVEAES